MKKKHPRIKYFDLWGLRKEKYRFLENHDVKNTKWQELKLQKPYYWFVPKDFGLEGKYKNFISVKSIFNHYGSGVNTRRDHFMVSQLKDKLKNRLSLFTSSQDDEIIKSNFSLPNTKYWKLSEARKIAKKTDFRKMIFEYCYRPFDLRYVYYNPEIIERGDARLPTIKHFFQDNLSILLSKKIDKPRWDDVFITNKIADGHSASARTYIFPLYLYEPHKKFIFKGQKHLDIKGTQKELDGQKRDKKSNIKDEIIKKLSDTYKKQIIPEQIFYYIYGILYSNIYRQKYNEFLKIDFPKIPFTKNEKVFSKISELGKELVELHLLKSPKLEKPIAQFPISTGNILKDNRVEKREYQEKEKRIYINEKQYFENIESEIWNYYIGGYQVLDKWLKDRIDKVLSPEDIEHYLKVITTLEYTISLQKQIDKIYSKIEENLV